MNPSIQILLNQKDRVVDVRATNSDGDKILSQVDFVGMTAEDAAEKYVSICTEAGFIDIDTNGTKVSITLTGSKNDYTELKNSLVKSVNKYFDKNGIIAGAVVEINDDIKTAFQKISADIVYLETKTKEELIEIYAEYVEDIKGVVYNQQSALSVLYSNLKSTFERETQVENITLLGVRASIASIEELIANQSEDIAEKLQPFFAIADAEGYEELQKSLNEAKKAVKESKLDDRIEDAINGVISSTQKILDDMKNTYQTAKNKFDEDYKKAVDDAVKKSNEYLQSIKAEIESKIVEGKERLNNRKAEVEANKADIEQRIASYRATLENA